MKTMMQTIILKGKGHWGSKPQAAAMGEVLRLIPLAVQYSVRMAFEGRSTIRGMRPAWLDAASDFRFVDHDGVDDTSLYFEVPRLGDAAPRMYDQKEFWSQRPDPNDTGFDLLGDVITDVSNANSDSERFDNPLLRRIERFDHALNAECQSLAVVARRYSALAPATITHRVIELAQELTDATPQSRAVRIFGRLDMIRASTRSFVLQLDGGEYVHAAAADSFDIGSLTPLFQKTVLVLGRAVYRPSGRLLRIDAKEVKAASDDQRFFSKIPAPQANLGRRAVYSPAAGRGGIAAIFGKWPGDETDAEVDAALKELH